jgi:hypothetical protein
VSANPVNAVDPWGLSSEQAWWNPVYWNSSDWGTFRRGLGIGAMAYIDGFIPFVDPFKSMGAYDLCNSDVADVYQLGELVSRIDLGLLVSGGYAYARAINFFNNTFYSSKVLAQTYGTEKGEFHSFPESVAAFSKNGKVLDVKGGDGNIYQKLNLNGEYNGKQGSFEFIKDYNGKINHRFFRPEP